MHAWRKVAGIALALSCTASAPARAQLGLRPGVTVAGGIGIPAAPDDFKNLHGAGVALSAGLHFKVAPLVGATLEAGYYRLPFDAGAYEATLPAPFRSVNVSGNDLFVIPVTLAAEVSLLPFGSTRPFASAGAGFYRIGTTDAVLSGPGSNEAPRPQDSSDNALGVRLGLGVRTPLTPLASFFLDATYHLAFTDPDRIGFVVGRAGVRF